MLLTILYLELLPAPPAEGYAKQQSLDRTSYYNFNSLCFVPALRVGNNIDILLKYVG